MTDYIERDMAIKSLQLEIIGEVDQFDIENLTLVCARKKLLKLPAADVAPVVHGRWLLESTNPYDNPRYKNRMIKVCSCCHWSNACKYNYCPNCGAKMDGEVTTDA